MMPRFTDRIVIAAAFDETFRTAMAEELFAFPNLCREFLKSTRTAGYSKKFLDWARTRKHRKPSTGNQVKWNSLTSQEQAAVYKQWASSQKGTPKLFEEGLKEKKKKREALPRRPEVERARKETYAAYSDTSPAPKGTKLDLDFRSGDWIPVSAWHDIMEKATPEGYNNFHAPQVAKILHAIEKEFGERLEVQPAREYSVAVYVRGSQEALRKLLKKVRADEKDMVSYDPPEVRLWWD
jgi:hypothetical protein